MFLRVASYLSYLSVSNSQSRVKGYCFLGNKVNTNLPLANQTIIHNALIYTEASILRYIMSTASKSEIAAAFVNAKLAIPEHICLLNIGYPQLAIPLEIDNTTAYGILTK